MIHADIQSTPHSETLRDTLGHSWNPQGHSWNPQSVLLKYKHIVEERVSFIFCIVSVIENCFSDQPLSKKEEEGSPFSGLSSS